MPINNFKYLKILTGLLAILAGLMLVGCQTPNPISTVDTTPPIITVAGFTNGQRTNVANGDGFVIPEATATDDIDKQVAVTTNDDEYDNNEIGIYNVTYTAEDNAGNSSTFTITIIVVSSDTTSPVIVVTGFTNGQRTTVVAGDGFVIPEAVAIDNVDGPVAVTTNDGGYDNNQESTYNVGYSASDSDGNTSVFTLTIIVDPDTMPPVITVIGFTNGQRTNVTARDGFAIPEATATDNADGSVAVITNEGGYNNNVTNTYNVEYTAEDNAGNSTNFTIAIIVAPDRIPPLITVTGFTNGQSTNVLASDGFIIPKATVIDNVDGMVTATTNNSGYDNNVPATYVVIYQASDIAGNSSMFTITIIVEDRTSPFITVVGFSNEQRTNVENGEFAIPEATALDNVDGLAAVTTNDDGYDSNVTNTYTVVYTAADNAGNANAFTLIIIVEDNYDIDGFNRETGIHRNLAKILANDGALVDAFGHSVAIDGDYAIVGDFFENTKGNRSGAAYIFNRKESNWIEQVKLTPLDLAPEDSFGWSVAINGDYAVAGAHFNNVNGINSGAAYIFNRKGSRWTEQAKLTANDGALSDYFGYSVAIDGDYAIVGAYLNNNNGAAYIFNRNGVSWIEQVKLTASDGASGDNFGWSVAINSGYAIVGATLDDDNGVNSGAAYVFNRNNGWKEEVKLIVNEGALYDHFGHSVAIDGDYAIVGAPQSSDNGEFIGAAYVFNRITDTNWSQQAKLAVSDGAMFDAFGHSVAIDGDYAIVGAILNNELNNGAAYVFNRTGTTWTEQVKLIADDVSVSGFGLSVSIDNNYILVGSDYINSTNNVDNPAYIYELRR
ncbi:MAG: HYR domain-containing protein [Gammaproteobacteria bacterium]|nr:HYR domain-containing protein [Gammaproteobacteria bacterium]